MEFAFFVVSPILIFKFPFTYLKSSKKSSLSFSIADIIFLTDPAPLP